MSKIVTSHNNFLEILIIFWVMIHLVWFGFVINWPPFSLDAWVGFILATILALYFDLGLLYMYFFYKDGPVHEIATKEETEK